MYPHAMPPHELIRLRDALLHLHAEARAIVVHTAWYAEPNVVQQMGRLGRSEGCFALPNSSHQEVMARLGPGHFLYADRLA